MLLKKNISKVFRTRQVIIKLILLMISFLIYGIIYFMFHDREFGGISLYQNEIRGKVINDYLEKHHTNLESISKDEFTDLLKNLEKSPAFDIQQSVSERIFNRIYFAIVTGTTVGYGDIYPVSFRVKTVVIMQLFTSLLILFY